jgi:hypothetical protein
MQFAVEIPNIAALQDAFASYPSIAQPILQSAIVASQAILAKFTTPGIVPVNTGYLVQHWGFDIGNLMARWYPQAAYAPYVELGTAPHIIRAVNAKVLANVKSGQVFGPVVHHPGTKANPFMERIVAAAQPEITEIFGQALTKITGAIASMTA